MRIPLAGRDEAAVFGAIAKATRQRIRKAQAGGVEIAGEATDAAFDVFYDLLRATGDRRGFTFGSRTEFVGWWAAASRAGHLTLLTARVAAEAPMLAGLLLYRHGGRLSTVHSADLASARAEHPGVLHLLRWRALQLAIAEGCTEMDLGGVDIAGVRRVPEPGDATFGLYEHKRSFGAEWVELAGAHEFVARPLRYAGGRIAQRLQREMTRRLPLARRSGRAPETRGPAGG
jgi:lipid II:glycine glycyltransferase (peptidoglycan interpeptide bridge formation enzyme)